MTLLSRLTGIFLCRVWFRKHKRGRRSTYQPVQLFYGLIVQYQCPRCGATWTRKSKPKPAEPRSERSPLHEANRTRDEGQNVMTQRAEPPVIPESIRK